MSLLSDYIETAIELEKLNNPSLPRENVKRNNKLAKKLREIASEIALADDQLKTDFSSLLSHENDNVRIWCSHHILELFDFGTDVNNIALKEIERKSQHDVGERFWLEKWKKQHS